MVWSRQKKRLFIIAGSIVLLFIILIISANALLSNRAEAFLREKLSTVDTTDYRIDFSSVGVNVFTRSVKVFDLHIIPKESAIDHVKLSRLAKPVFEVMLDRLAVNNISISKAIKGKGYQVGRILLDRPRIKMYGANPIFSKVEKESPDKGSFTADSNLRQLLASSSLGSFRIKDASISYMDMSRDKEVLTTTGIDINLDNVSFTDSSNQLPLSIDIEEFEIAFASHKMELPGGFYQLQTAALTISYEEQDILIDSFRLIPAYQKGQFGKAFGKQTDRFDLLADQIHIKDIIFDSLKQKKVIIDEILIDKPQADIFRDKRVARDMKIFPSLFQTSIANLPLELNIDSVNLVNSWLKYQEMIDDTKVPGYVEFDQMNIKIEGINNHPEKIRQGQSMVVSARARLMKTSSIEAYFDLPIGRKDEFFTFHGKTASFPAKSLNPMMEPLAHVGFSKGNIERVEFYGLAKKDTAVGRMEFLYSDLEVMVIKKDKMKEGQVAENKFLSAVTKALLHKNNPLDGNAPRIGTMSFIRDPNKGFFNYYWKTIQSGLVNTILPGKKKNATDMDWASFKNQWQNVLLQDREDLILHDGKRKKRK